MNLPYVGMVFIDKDGEQMVMCFEDHFVYCLIDDNYNDNYIFCHETWFIQYPFEDVTQRYIDEQTRKT